VPEQATWTVARPSGGGYRQALLSHALGRSLWLTGPGGKEVVASRSLVLDSPVEQLRRVPAPRRERSDRHHRRRLRPSRLRRQQERARDARDRIGGPPRLRAAARAHLALPAGGEDVRLPVRDGDGVYNCAGPPNALDLALGRDVRNWAPRDFGVRTVEISTPPAERRQRQGRANFVIRRGCVKLRA
jgi:hypothetical protein